jgi:hypothetical protein
MSEQPPESPRLNALGKPLSPSYDPNYKIKTPLSSINRLRAPMSPGILREPISPDEEQRWRAARECIAKGDKAQRKADDWYITAGQHLKALKAEHDKRNGTWTEWEILLKEKVGIRKTRASELMAIADGRKDVEQVRADANKRKIEHRKKVSPFRNGESAPEPEAAGDEAMKIEAATEARKQPTKKVATPPDNDLPDRNGEVIEAIINTVSQMHYENKARLRVALREKFGPDPVEEAEEEAEGDAEGELDLVEEILDGQPLSDKQAAVYQKIKNRLKRRAREEAKQEAQNKKFFDEMKRSLAPLAAKLVAAGLARELWEAIVSRTGCGMALHGSMAFYLGNSLVAAIEEALGDALYERPCSVENAPPPGVGADNMRAQIAALDDGPTA